MSDKYADYSGITITMSKEDWENYQKKMDTSFTYTGCYDCENVDIQCKVIDDVSYIADYLKDKPLEQGRVIEKCINTLRVTETYYPIIGIQTRRGFILFNPLSKRGRHNWQIHGINQVLERITRDGYLKSRMIIGGSLDIRRYCDIIVDFNEQPKVISVDRETLDKYEIDILQLHDSIMKFVNENFDMVPLMNIERFIEKYNLYEKYRK